MCFWAKTAKFWGAQIFFGRFWKKMHFLALISKFDKYTDATDRPDFIRDMTVPNLCNLWEQKVDNMPYIVLYIHNNTL